MPNQFKAGFSTLKRRTRRLLFGPQVLAFLPAMALGAFWVGGEQWLIMIALGLPVVFALVGVEDRGPRSQAKLSTPALDSEHVMREFLEIAAKTNRNTACLVVQLDDFAELINRYGQNAGEHITLRTSERLFSVLRDDDVVISLGQGRFVIALSPIRRFGLETAIQLSGRLQAAVEEPLSLDATTVFASCCIGFCTDTRNPGHSAQHLINAAQAALAEALQNAPSAVRAYSEAAQIQRGPTPMLADEAGAALEDGQIQAWFQPQVSTDTGHVTGFEALARWKHPQRGMISPAQFLPVLEQTGLMRRLGEVMMYQSFTAMKGWDAAGLDVPMIGINFSPEELRDPKLVDKVRWELDRFDLAPHRLSVEVLETVVAASPDDVVSRNVNGLSELGCHIDLDDFGTGHASISSIRRFAVSRIKIDRSFIMKVDRDPEQQRIVSAILTMAERLGMEALAEGVETAGEHAMLGQLGCGHVQGFGIARPMPEEQTIEWVRTHNAKVQAPPKIGRPTR